MKVILAGPGAFGTKHLDSMKKIDDVEVVAIVGDNPAANKSVAEMYGADHSFTDLAEALKMSYVDAAVLCTPTQIHAEQAIQCMRSASAFV